MFGRAVDFRSATEYVDHYQRLDPGDLPADRRRVASPRNRSATCAPAICWRRVRRQCLSALIRLQIGNELMTRSACTRWSISTRSRPSRPGIRQFIVLEDLQKTARFTVAFDVYDDQPVIRYRRAVPESDRVHRIMSIRSTCCRGPSPICGRRYTRFPCQSVDGGRPPGGFRAAADAARSRRRLRCNSHPGAHGQQCGWLAVRDGEHARPVRRLGVRRPRQDVGAARRLRRVPGVFGVDPRPEPPGRATGRVRRARRRFIGLFHGDFDEAGYRTQRFVEAVLAKPAPDQAFPVRLLGFLGLRGEHRRADAAPQRGPRGGRGRGVVRRRPGLGAQHRRLVRGPGEIPQRPRRARGLRALARHEVRPPFRAGRGRSGQPGAAGQSGLDRHRRRQLPRRRVAVPFQPAGARLDCGSRRSA